MPPKVTRKGSHLNLMSLPHFHLLLCVAAILAFHAGYVNVSTLFFLHFFSLFFGFPKKGLAMKSAYAMTVSHVTGLITRVGFLTAEGDSVGVFNNFELAFAFFAGAVISGLFIGKKKFSLKYRYGPLLMLEGLVLILVGAIMEGSNPNITTQQAVGNKYRYAISLTASAMGIQNALFTIYSGAIIRTTHYTGITTDLGKFFVRFFFFFLSEMVGEKTLIWI